MLKLMGKKILTVFKKCIYLDLCGYLQEVTQSVIPYWQKDQLRTELKGLKKRLDDLDKARKAAVISEVAEQAKQMIADQPDQKYIVHEFKAGSNAKVRG